MAGTSFTIFVNRLNFGITANKNCSALVWGKEMALGYYSIPLPEGLVQLAMFTLYLW